jgi:hypothetical protein
MGDQWLFQLSYDYLIVEDFNRGKRVSSNGGELKVY